MTASCGFPRPPDVGPDETTCQLLAVVPSIANTDDPITIEGTFDDAVMVNFPGGAAVPATMLGPHRASVRVPASATAGELTITTCGSTIGALPFRRASFPLDLGTFGEHFEQTAGARQFPTLVTPRSNHTSALIGGHLYVLGGAGVNGSLDSVEHAMVNADGTLGQFAIVRSTLVVPRRAHTSHVIGSRTYVIGGLGDAPLNSVEQAAIEPDDSLGSFTTVSGVTLVTARSGHASVVVANYLYVLGGLGTNTLNNVERATIGADGTLGPFAPVPGIGLATARHGHTAKVIGNYVYVIGGIGALKGVERATIDRDGSLGPFAAVSESSLTVARSEHATEVIGNYLYAIFGGAGGGLSLNSIERAPLDADGALGPFEALPSRTTALESRGHTTAIVGNCIYVLGGAGSFGLLKRGLTASLNGGRALTAFATISAGTLVNARAGHTATVIGNYLYVLGGTGGATTVERATINTDGLLGPFGPVAGVALTTLRRQHATAVVGNYLYLLGGDENGSVERAAIQPDGSLGAFSPVLGTSLRIPRFYHSVAAIGDYLYVFGGVGPDPVSSIEKAIMNADGSLGQFAIIDFISLTVPRAQHASALLGDYLYVIGGMSAIQLDLPTVERADVHNDLTSFNTVTDVSITATRGLTAGVVGQSLYVLGGSPSIVERATINSDNSLGTFGPSDSGELITSRFFPATVVLKNYVHVLEHRSVRNADHLDHLRGCDRGGSTWQGLA